MNKTLVALSIMVGFQSSVLANEVELLCGNTIDVKAKKTTGKRLIQIEDGKIISITQTSKVGANTVDLSDYTCLPGLIDMHVHLTSQSSPSSYSEGFRLNPSDFAYRAALLNLCAMQ